MRDARVRSTICYRVVKFKDCGMNKNRLGDI